MTKMMGEPHRIELLIPCKYCTTSCDDLGATPQLQEYASFWGHRCYYYVCPVCYKISPWAMTVIEATMHWYNEHRPPFSDRAVIKDGRVVLVNDPVFFVSGGILKYWDMSEHQEEEMAVPRGACGPNVSFTNEEKEVDNWKHRSSNMRCHTCMWYMPKALAEEVNHGPTLGRCRRHAPTMNGFPVVYVDDWCGDHKVDEEKI